MELYHSKGKYPILRVHPYGFDLEEPIAQTAFQTIQANGVFILMIVITYYISQCHVGIDQMSLQGKASGLEFSSSISRGYFRCYMGPAPLVWGLGRGASQR